MRRPPSNLRSDYWDTYRLDALQIILCSRLDELFDKLGLSFYRSRRAFFGPCPVHGGDNPQGLNLYPEGESVAGYWRCNTHHCEKTFRATIVGFVRGVLSHHRYNWGGQDCKQTVSFREAVDWCCQFVGKPLHEIEVNYQELDQKKYASQISILSMQLDPSQPLLTRPLIRKHLEIPARYMMERGWSPEVLSKYDVGFYPYEGRRLTNRVVVPIYDETHQFAIGFTGRSVFPKCEQCGSFHNGSCFNFPEGREDSSKNCLHVPKWFNQDFQKDSVLYNYWFAKNHIQKTGVAILTEGPGEVWKLEMAGIHQGVALLGTDLSDRQQVLLEMSGAMDVVVLLNDDDAGKEASLQLKMRLSRAFRLHFPTLGYVDVGETPIEHIQSVLQPILSIERNF